LLQKPESGKRAARAAEQMRKVANVFGMYFRMPPMSFFMSKLWTECDTEPAPRNSPALKKAWVKRWKRAAVHAPTPRAMTM
jgi:hypothetical protein